MPKVTMSDLSDAQLRPKMVSDADAKSFLDTADFRKYCDLVSALFTPGRKLCIRDIHNALGDTYRNWTLDAIEAADGLIEVGILPTRWERSEYRVKKNQWVMPAYNNRKAPDSESIYVEASMY